MKLFNHNLFVLVIFLLLSLNGIGQINVDETIVQAQNNHADGNLTKAAELYNKLAFYYWETGAFQKALDAFEQSLTINKEIGNDNALKAIYTNMGMINNDVGQVETSLVFFRKSLLISRKLNQRQDIGTNLMNIALSLEMLGRDTEALKNLEEALSIIMETSNPKLLRSCYGSLAELHEKLGNSEKSMEYFTMYASFQKKIQQEEVEKEKQESRIKVAQSEKKVEEAMQEKVKTEQKLEVTKDSLKVAEEINIQNKMRLQLQAEKIKSQRLLTIVFVIVTLLLAIIAVFILWSYSQKKKHNKILEARNVEIKKQNEEIKEKNTKINQSINYAQNIQGALLPELKIFEKMFDDSFVFFQPRDIVSGDFYWFTSHKVNSNIPQEIKIVAAVDCTGHGVPGAFMSMLGISFLEEIVDKRIFEPVIILEQMHCMIKSSLKQEQSGNTDGMDMALCVYNESTKKIKFAGAVNPLVYMQDGEMYVEKGEFFGVGGLMKSNEKSFTLKEIDVSKPTTCYMFSDGYADQFGGDSGQKYLSKRFRKLLHEIHKKPMAEQKEILNTKLKEWKGTEYDAIDDVLVMGFKIN